MNKDTQNTQGRFRLEGRKVNKLLFILARIFNAINLNRYTTIIAQKFGTPVFDTGFMHNLGMTVRLPVVSGLYVGSGSQTAFTYLAVGSSATAVAANQTALVAEITTTGLGRASATASRTTTNSTNDTSQLTYTWTATGNATINEIGYFNASSVGVMGGRALTGTLSVANGVLFTGTYQIIHS